MTSGPFEQQVRELILKWKTILGLEDWEIGFVVVTDGDSSLEGAYAISDTEILKKQLFIRLQNPNAKNYDLELCIIHELCHAHFALMDPWHDCVDKNDPAKCAYCTAEEQAIHALSKAVLRRSAPKSEWGKVVVS